MTELGFSGKPSPKIRRARRAFGFGTILFGIGCIFVLDQFDIVMNASRSLDEPAYIVYDQPVLLSRGAVVAAEMPAILQSRFGDYRFVKRIGGVPGDEITLDENGSPCVNGTCYPVWLKNGAPVASLIGPGVIPEGYYALFGTSDDSLDSRYAVIGLIPEDKITGRGWPLAIMADFREVDQ